MGAELLIFLGWFTGVLNAIWVYLITTGTNAAVIKLFLGNILLFLIIAKITPGEWDNKFIEWLKETISNFRSKKGEDDVAEPKK